MWSSNKNGFAKHTLNKEADGHLTGYKMVAITGYQSGTVR